MGYASLWPKMIKKNKTENEYPDEKKNVYILCIKDANWIWNKGHAYGKCIWNIWGAFGGKELNADKPLTGENNIWI